MFIVFNLQFCILYLSVTACRGRKCKPIFVQIARQVVKLNASDLRLPSRAWKVKLVGEGADDAGGVFDDTITEMCQVCSCSLKWFLVIQQVTAVVWHSYISVFAGAGDGRGRPAHPLPQRHRRGRIQPRQVRRNRKEQSGFSPSSLTESIFNRLLLMFKFTSVSSLSFQRWRLFNNSRTVSS